MILPDIREISGSLASRTEADPAYPAALGASAGNSTGVSARLAAIRSGPRCTRSHRAASS